LYQADRENCGLAASRPWERCG